MNIKKYFDKDYNAFKIEISFYDKVKFPSIITFEIYGFITSLKPVIDNDIEVLTTNPELFDTEKDVDKYKYFELFIVSKLSPNKLMEIINSELVKYKEIEKFNISQWFNDVIEQRSAIRQKVDDIDLNQQKVESIKININKIEELGNLINELIITNSNINKEITTISKNQKLKKSLNNLYKLVESNNSLRIVSERLQVISLEMRMIPLSTIFRKIPRIVRDISKKTNKKIDIKITGEQISLDKTTIEKLNAPIVHLIRNSVDHGIESLHERQLKNKNVKGQINIEAYNEGDAIIIKISDDGKGLNHIKIINKAIKKGLITKTEAEKYNNEDIRNLIFKPGFSTAEEISDVSGRGVGLDVVNDIIKKLNGTINIDSEKDKGTTFILRIPLNFIQSLIIKSGNETLAIPLSSVVEINDWEETKSHSFINNIRIIEHKNSYIPVFSLNKLMEFGENENRNRYIINILSKSNNKYFGLLVNDIIGKQEIIIRNLGDYLGKIDCISGATIYTNSRRIVLILDIKSLSNKISNYINYNELENIKLNR